MSSFPSTRTEPTSRTALSIAAILLAFGITYSCVERPGEEKPTDPDRTAFLESSARCVLTQAETFAESAKNLREAASSWNDDVAHAEARETVQDAWHEAMLDWQQLEVMQLGPIGSSNSPDAGGAIGGRDLRSQIYSWPNVNACSVDQDLVAETWDDELESESVNVRGLDAIEYLLFEDGTESACPTTASIISGGDWDAVMDLDARRAAYALAAAEQVESLANDVVAAWSADGKDFTSQLVSAGELGPYETQNDGVNAVTDALFYIEKMVKDLKVGIFAEIVACPATGVCPKVPEHEHAGISKRSVEANISGFETLYFGCGGEEPMGLDALLRADGAGTLADEIEAALDGVHGALDAIEEADLAVTLVGDRESFVALYDALKVLTDLMKEQVVVVLNVDLPQTVSGDND